MTAASKGVLLSAESLSPEEVVGLAGAASLAGSVLDMVSLGYIRQGSSRLFVELDWEVASFDPQFWGRDCAVSQEGQGAARRDRAIEKSALVASRLFGPIQRL